MNAAGGPPGAGAPRAAAAPGNWGQMQTAWLKPVLLLLLVLIVLYPFAPKAVVGFTALILLLVAAQGVRNGKIPFLK